MEPDSALIDDALGDARRCFDDVFDAGAILFICNWKQKQYWKYAVCVPQFVSN